MVIQTAILALAVAIPLLLVSAIKWIPEGHAYTLTRFGKPNRMLLPGFHMVLPLFEQVAHKISLSGRALTLEAQLPTRPDCAIKGRVYWQVLDPERADAMIDNADKLLRDGVLEALALHPEPTSEPELARNARLKQALNQEMRPRGVLVTRVDLDLAA